MGARERPEPAAAAAAAAAAALTTRFLRMPIAFSTSKANARLRTYKYV